MAINKIPKKVCDKYGLDNLASQFLSLYRLDTTSHNEDSILFRNRFVPFVGSIVVSSSLAYSLSDALLNVRNYLLTHLQTGYVPGCGYPVIKVVNSQQDIELGYVGYDEYVHIKEANTYSIHDLPNDMINVMLNSAVKQLISKGLVRVLRLRFREDSCLPDVGYEDLKTYE